MKASEQIDRVIDSLSELEARLKVLANYRDEIETCLLILSELRKEVKK